MHRYSVCQKHILPVTQLCWSGHRLSRCPHRPAGQPHLQPWPMLPQSCREILWLSFLTAALANDPSC